MACEHLNVTNLTLPQAHGCVDCLKTGGRWVHLRLCAQCGYVGCCDSSPNRHARRHAAGSGHPVVQSFEPGEDWLYCFIDDEMAGPAVLA